METYYKWQMIAHILQCPAWKSFPKACCHWPWRTLGGCDIWSKSSAQVNVMMSKTRRLETSFIKSSKHINRKCWQVIPVLQYSLFKCWEGKKYPEQLAMSNFKTSQHIGNAIFLPQIMSFSIHSLKQKVTPHGKAISWPSERYIYIYIYVRITYP